MKLEEMTMKALLVAHNAIAEKQAGPKSFKTKAHLIARTRLLAKAKELDQRALRHSKSVKKTKADPIMKAKVADVVASPKKPKGASVGALARRILVDPSGTPYETIALLVNHLIPCAKATAQSVAWYASRMRKEGVYVPKRVATNSACPWIDDPAIVDQWLTESRI